MLKFFLVGLLLSQGAFALTVHEWGTFTSLVNEKGELMSGMQHEEVGLPGFVYGLRAEGQGLQNQLRGNGHCPPRSKCAFPSPASELNDIIPFSEFDTRVTQKMETPVIYFYGNKAEKVHVEVSFPEGMISQWFPAASDFNQHLEQFKNGFMSWDVTLKEVEDISQYPATRPESIWNPARGTKANTIQTSANGTEEERFIFYRGLGDFNVPLKVTLSHPAQGKLKVTVENQSAETVPSLFYISTIRVE